MNRYEQLAQIGKGSFGVVYKSRIRQTGQLVALKQISTYGKTKQELQALRQEIELLRELEHPYIIKFYESFEESGNIVIVTEMAQSDLFDIVTMDGKLSISTLQLVAYQVLTALQFMHSLHVAHRDIKAQNILVANGTCKLADFGFAKQSVRGNDMFASVKGTPLYLAPEVLSGKPYDGCMADIWSLGIMLFELACGSAPFRTTDLGALIKQLQDPALQIPYTSYRVFSDHPHLRALLESMLQRDPASRLDAGRLLHHPFIEEGNRTLIVAKGPSSSGLMKDWYAILRRVRDEAALQRLQLKNAVYTSQAEILREFAASSVPARPSPVVTKDGRPPFFPAQVRVIPSVSQLVQHCIKGTDLGEPAESLLELFERADDVLPCLRSSAVSDLVHQTGNDFYVADYTSLLNEMESLHATDLVVQQCYDRAVDYLSFLIVGNTTTVSTVLTRIGSLLDAQDCGIVEQIFLALYLRLLAVLGGCSFSRVTDLRFGPIVEFPFNFQITEEVASCPSSASQPITFTPRAHVQASFIYVVTNQALMADLEDRLLGVLSCCLQTVNQGTADHNVVNCSLYNIFVTQKLLISLLSASQFLFRDYRIHLAMESRLVPDQSVQGRSEEYAAENPDRGGQARGGEGQEQPKPPGPARAAGKDVARDIDYDISFNDPRFGPLLTRDGGLDRYITPSQLNFCGIERTDILPIRDPRPVLLSTWRGRSGAGSRTGTETGPAGISFPSDQDPLNQYSSVSQALDGSKRDTECWNYTSISLTDKLVLYSRYFVSLLIDCLLKELSGILTPLYGMAKTLLRLQNGIELEEAGQSLFDGLVYECISSLYEGRPRSGRRPAGTTASSNRSSMTHGLPSSSSLFQPSTTTTTRSSTQPLGPSGGLDSSFGDRATPTFGEPDEESRASSGPTFPQLAGYLAAWPVAKEAAPPVPEDPDPSKGTTAATAAKGSCLPLKAPAFLFEVLLELRISTAGLFLALSRASTVLLPGKMMRFGNIATHLGFYRPRWAFLTPGVAARDNPTIASELQTLVTLTSRSDFSSLIYNEKAILGTYFSYFRHQLFLLYATLPFVYPFSHDEGMEETLLAAWPDRLRGILDWGEGDSDSQPSTQPKGGQDEMAQHGDSLKPPLCPPDRHTGQVDSVADVAASAPSDSSGLHVPQEEDDDSRLSEACTEELLPIQQSSLSLDGEVQTGSSSSEDSHTADCSADQQENSGISAVILPSNDSQTQIPSPTESECPGSSQTKPQDDEALREYRSLMQGQLSRLKMISVQVLATVCGPSYQRLFPAYSLAKKDPSPLHESALYLRAMSKRLALENGDEIPLREIKSPNLRATIEHFSKITVPARGGLIVVHPEIAYYVNGQGIPQRYFSSAVLADPLSPERMYQSVSTCISSYFLSFGQDVIRTIVSALLDGSMLTHGLVSSIFITKFLEVHSSVFQDPAGKQFTSRAPNTILYQGLPCKAYVSHAGSQGSSDDQRTEKPECTVDHQYAARYMQADAERRRLRLLIILYRCAYMDPAFLSKLTEIRFFYEDSTVTSETGAALSFSLSSLLLIAAYWLYSHSDEEDLRLSLLALMLSRDHAHAISGVLDDERNVALSFGLADSQGLLLRSFAFRYGIFAEDFARQVREANRQLETVASKAPPQPLPPSQTEIVVEVGEALGSQEVAAADDCARPRGFVIRPGTLWDCLEYDVPTLGPSSYLSYAAELGCQGVEEESSDQRTVSSSSSLADTCLDAVLYHQKRSVSRYFSPYFLGTGTLVSIPVGANYREQEVTAEAVYAGLDVFLELLRHIRTSTAEEGDSSEILHETQEERDLCLAGLRTYLSSVAEAVSQALFYSLDLCLVEPIIRAATPPTQTPVGILDTVVHFIVEAVGCARDAVLPLFYKLSIILNLCCDNSVAEAFGSAAAPPHHVYSSERYARQKPCPTSLHCAVINGCLDCLKALNASVLPSGEVERLAVACDTLSKSQPQWKHLLGPQGVYWYSHAVRRVLESLQGELVSGLDYDILGREACTIEAQDGDSPRPTTCEGIDFRTVNYALFPEPKSPRTPTVREARPWPMREICHLLTHSCSQPCLDAILMSPRIAFGGLDAAERTLASALAALGALEQRVRKSNEIWRLQRAETDSDLEADSGPPAGQEDGSRDTDPATEEAGHLGLEFFGPPDVSPVFCLSAILLDCNFIGRSLQGLSHMESRDSLLRPLLAIFCDFALSSAEQVSIPWCVQLASSDLLSLSMVQVVFGPRTLEQRFDLDSGVVEYCLLLARLASLHPLLANLVMETIDYTVLNSLLYVGAPTKELRDEEGEAAEAEAEGREQQGRVDLSATDLLHAPPPSLTQSSAMVVISGCKLFSALTCHNSLHHMALRQCLPWVIVILSNKRLDVLEAACSALLVFSAHLPEEDADSFGIQPEGDSDTQLQSELEEALLPTFPQVSRLLVDARTTDAAKARLAWCAAVLASRTEELLEGAWREGIPQILVECIENCSPGSGREFLLMAHALERLVSLPSIQRRMARNRNILRLRRILEKREALKAADPSAHGTLLRAYRVLKGVVAFLSRARK